MIFPNSLFIWLNNCPLDKVQCKSSCHQVLVYRVVSLSYFPSEITYTFIKTLKLVAYGYRDLDYFFLRIRSAYRGRGTPIETIRQKKALMNFVIFKSGYSTDSRKNREIYALRKCLFLCVSIVDTKRMKITDNWLFSVSI